MVKLSVVLPTRSCLSTWPSNSARGTQLEDALAAEVVLEASEFPQAASGRGHNLDLELIGVGVDVAGLVPCLCPHPVSERTPRANRCSTNLTGAGGLDIPAGLVLGENTGGDQVADQVSHWVPPPVLELSVRNVGKPVLDA